jgi:uncharacterized C2H2 Zn-finger protein
MSNIGSKYKKVIRSMDKSGKSFYKCPICDEEFMSRRMNIIHQNKHSKKQIISFLSKWMVHYT